MKKLSIAREELSGKTTDDVVTEVTAFSALALKGTGLAIGCQLCGGTGLVEKHNGKGFLATSECVCAKGASMMKYRLQLFEESNITRKELASYKVSEYIGVACSFDRLIDFVKYDIIEKGETGSRLYLYGGVGTGKSYSAVLAAMIGMTFGYSALYYPVADLLDDLRPNSGKVYSDVMSDCEECDILILDDIGQEKESQWVGEILFQIINKRYRAGRKTILTSNKTIDEIGMKYERPAITSRLNMLCTVMNFGNKDKRI